MPSLQTVCRGAREAKGVRREVRAVATGVKRVLVTEGQEMIDSRSPYEENVNNFISFIKVSHRQFTLIFPNAAKLLSGKAKVQIQIYLTSKSTLPEERDTFRVEEQT